MNEHASSRQLWRRTVLALISSHGSLKATLHFAAKAVVLQYTLGYSGALHYLPRKEMIPEPRDDAFRGLAADRQLTHDDRSALCI
jgi:hypothetical protein